MRNLVLLGTLLAGMLPTLASAAEPDLRGQRLAATCANCHGTNGQTKGNSLPALAGKSQSDLINILQEYKQGIRSGTVMPQLAKGYSDLEIGLLAQFFAAQKAKE